MRKSVLVAIALCATLAVASGPPATTDEARTAATLDRIADSPPRLRIFLAVPAEPLAMYQQIAVLEGTSGVVLDKKVASDNIQMITSLVLHGVGIGILTSLDIITEVKRGLLSFTRISDPILRPMTLALCTAAARTPSHAAGLVLSEIEHGFAQLSYPASIEPASDALA